MPVDKPHSCSLFIEPVIDVFVIDFIEGEPAACLILN
jgi:hypothetical protein